MISQESTTKDVKLFGYDFRGHTRGILVVGIAYGYPNYKGSAIFSPNRVDHLKDVKLFGSQSLLQKQNEIDLIESHNQIPHNQFMMKTKLTSIYV